MAIISVIFTGTVPDDFISLVKVEAVGAGASGQGTAGGAGGAYAVTSYIPGLTAGATIPFQNGGVDGTRGTSLSPGTADTWFNSGDVLFAQGALGTAQGLSSACYPVQNAQSGGHPSGSGGGAGGPKGAGTNGSSTKGGDGDASYGGVGGIKGYQGSTGTHGQDQTGLGGGAGGPGGPGGNGGTGGPGGSGSDWFTGIGSGGGGGQGGQGGAGGAGGSGKGDSSTGGAGGPGGNGGAGGLGGNYGAGGGGGGAGGAGGAGGPTGPRGPNGASGSPGLGGRGKGGVVLFTYSNAIDPTQPKVSTIIPSVGSVSGGTQVIIGGINFASGAIVTFGNATATNIVISPSTVTCSAPPGVGEVDIVVTNPGGYASPTSPADVFTYIESVNPQATANFGSMPFSLTPSTGFSAWSPGYVTPVYNDGENWIIG